MSTILSEMSEPSSLSFPDYNQTCIDHRRLLVLVRSVSPATLRPKTFARVFEVLDRGARVHINSAEDVTRQVEVRFVRSYPVENNEWGDFQHHRAVLGLISIGAYRNEQEHEELGRLHESIRVSLIASFIFPDKLNIAIVLLCRQSTPNTYYALA